VKTKNLLSAFIRRWVNASDAAAVLSKKSRSAATYKAKQHVLHARLRAARDAGYVAGVKVR
jgi:hypothetical protein